MERFYHGTTALGLTELTPHLSPGSNLDFPCVYLTANHAMAAIYIWNLPFRWMSFHVAEDGIPVVTESFPGHLHEFYDGVKGAVYVCEGDSIEKNDGGIRHAAISRTPIDVIHCEEVPDAYARLLAHESAGELRIRRYEELTRADHEGRERTVMKTIRHFQLLEEETHPLGPFIRDKFPQVWRRALEEAT